MFPPLFGGVKSPFAVRLFPDEKRFSPGGDLPCFKGGADTVDELRDRFNYAANESDFEAVRVKGISLE